MTCRFCSHLLAMAGILAILVNGERLLPAAAQEPAGRAAAVHPAARGTPPVAAPRMIVVGLDVLRNERIVTDAGGQIQLIFNDRSTLSIGPNSDLVIDEFVYAPESASGRTTIRASRGIFRYVGGAISKTSEVHVITPSGVAGIRGSAMIVEVEPEAAAGPARMIATFLHGQKMRVVDLRCVEPKGEIREDDGCVMAEVVRPGISVEVINGKANPPKHVDAEFVNQRLSRIEANGGAAADLPSR